MKKVALVFLLAVLVPSLVLAWLAIRSLRDQQFILERQQSLHYQRVTDSFAKEINDYLAEKQREFNAQVESLVAGKEPRAVASGFDDTLRKNWPLAEVGFCVTVSGSILCPTPTNSPEARIFCLDNGAFLGNRESAEVYWNNLKIADLRNNASPAVNSAQEFQQRYGLPAQSQPVQEPSAPLTNVYAGKVQARKINPAQQGEQNQTFNDKSAQGPNYSKVVSAEAEFHQLIGDASDGMMARFLQNKLRLMFWHRLEQDPQLVFGAQLNLNKVTRVLRDLLIDRSEQALLNPDAGSRNIESTGSASSWGEAQERKEICLLLLDDNAKAVAVSDRPLYDTYFDFDRRGAGVKQPFDAAFRQHFKTDPKHPFVATEIGEALPHWEVAAYLRNPDSLKQSVRTTQLTLGLLILVLVLAIGVGSWLIGRELNRQLTLARQKTDFVSNVSHELKTPLTSIRMFSELLAEGRVTDPGKQRSYLHIITAEAARLTRLINNVLDFSRLERNEKKYNVADCDLVAVARDTAEAYRPHLENNGFKFECSLPAYPLPVRGDSDALAQIIVNLLSNAEKYSNGPKEIALQVSRQDGPLSCAEVRIVDRGPGVPRGCEEKIFEKFYRTHDSLSSGIQGSGLGLTLARQIAHAHGGDVVYEPREGGGSCFCLRLPLNEGQRILPVSI